MADPENDGEEYILLAKIAQAAERYVDMAKYMKEYMESENANVAELEYRNLLLVAFKEVVEEKKMALNALRAQLMRTKESAAATPNLIQKVEIYILEVKGQLKEICLTVLVRLGNLTELVIASYTMMSCIVSYTIYIYILYIYKDYI